MVEQAGKRTRHLTTVTFTILILLSIKSLFFFFIQTFCFAEDPNEGLEGYNQRAVSRVSEIFQAF